MRVSMIAQIEFILRSLLRLGFFNYLNIFFFLFVFLE